MMKHVEELSRNGHCHCARCSEENRRGAIMVAFWCLVMAPLGFVTLLADAKALAATAGTTLYIVVLICFAFRKDFTKHIRF